MHVTECRSNPEAVRPEGQQELNTEECRAWNLPEDGFTRANSYQE